LASKAPIWVSSRADTVAPLGFKFFHSPQPAGFGAIFPSAFKPNVLLLPPFYIWVGCIGMAVLQKTSLISY
jgi:hypothetical protein